jgi:hypothetical protein
VYLSGHILDARRVHTLNLVSNGLGPDLNERLDLEVVGGDDDIEEHVLIIVAAEEGRAEREEIQ